MLASCNNDPHSTASVSSSSTFHYTFQAIHGGRCDFWTNESADELRQQLGRISGTHSHVRSPFEEPSLNATKVPNGVLRYSEGAQNCSGEAVAELTTYENLSGSGSLPANVLYEMNARNEDSAEKLVDCFLGPLIDEKSSGDDRLFSARFTSLVSDDQLAFWEKQRVRLAGEPAYHGLFDVHIQPAASGGHLVTIGHGCGEPQTLPYFYGSPFALQRLGVGNEIQAYAYPGRDDLALLLAFPYANWHTSLKERNRRLRQLRAAGYPTAPDLLLERPRAGNPMIRCAATQRYVISSVGHNPFAQDPQFCAAIQNLSDDKKAIARTDVETTHRLVREQSAPIPDMYQLALYADGHVLVTDPEGITTFEPLDSQPRKRALRIAERALSCF